jgi:ribonuclease BN (tRNA processing enzyme)
LTFDLTVLGCDGSYPGPGGAGSGYLLQGEGTTVWLDAGPGTLANLQTHVRLDDLDAVVVSHQHIDHWSDLEHLAVACKYVVPRPPIPLFSWDDLTSAQLSRSPAAAEVFSWHRVGPGARVRVGSMHLAFCRTAHPVETLAVRVDCAGRSLGYSADTGPAWELSELGAGLDLALCEATYLSGRRGAGLEHHLSARQAGETARRAECGRLVITHLWPTVDRSEAAAEASAAFGAEADVAAIGACYAV